MTKLRVLLADDHKVMREGLRLLVSAQADMEVVAEADNGRTAVILAADLQLRVVATGGTYLDPGITDRP